MKQTKDTYFIAHGANSVHYGFVKAGTNLNTGQPTLEKFDTESQYLARLKELGVEPESDETHYG